MANVFEDEEVEPIPVTDGSLAPVDESGRWTEVKSIVDSGCSDHCTSRTTAPGVAVVPSEGSQRGQKRSQVGAGGKGIVNEGKQHLPLQAPVPDTSQQK